MQAQLERFQYVVVEGAVGVGKTSLAKRLAPALGAQLVLEQPQDNPFLPQFYETGRGTDALATQFYFLIQRLGQQNALLDMTPAQRLVSDYLWGKNGIFAQLTLPQQEHALYQRISDLVTSRQRFAAPDLIIWLQADAPTLLTRVKKRGLSIEQHVDQEYLERLSQAYAQFFQQDLRVPVFAVNTEHFNPADDEAHFDMLLQRLEAFRGGREFFNPQL